MFRTSAFLALTAAILVINPVGSRAQNLDQMEGADIKPAGRRNVNRVLARHVAAELERQQEFFRAVTARFEAVAVHDFTPLLQYSYVWTALRENRARMARHGSRLTSAESKLLTDGYDALEKEVVATFGDHQLGILNDVLELNDLQFEGVARAVEDDLSVRRDLLKTEHVSEKDFASKLREISANTESRILAILFPEQRKVFDRQLNFNRDRLVG